LLLNKFFSDCRYVPFLRRYSRQSCAMVPRWRFLVTFLHPVFFSEPRAAGFRPASEICTKATPCVEVWKTSNLRRLRLGEEKKEVTTGQKYNGLPYSIGRPQIVSAHQTPADASHCELLPRPLLKWTLKCLSCTASDKFLPMRSKQNLRSTIPACSNILSQVRITLLVNSDL